MMTTDRNKRGTKNAKWGRKRETKTLLWGKIF